MYARCSRSAFTRVFTSSSSKGSLTGTPQRLFPGCEASVPRSCVPEAGEGEFYYSDLIGMEVFTEDGTLVGRVDNVFPTGSNDVLEVSGPLGDVLIPVIESVVLRVDRAEKKITVRLMEGLLPE